MALFDVGLDEKQLKEISEMMSCVKNGADKAISKAINYSLIRGKKLLIKEILSTYYVDKEEVSKALTVERSKTQNLEGKIIAKSRVLQIYKHKVDVRDGKIYASVRKDKQSLREGAFIKQVKSFTGRGTVSETDVKSRIFKSINGRLITLHGASVPGMAGNDEVTKNVLGNVNYMLGERITVEMIKLLGG